MPTKSITKPKGRPRLSLSRGPRIRYEKLNFKATSLKHSLPMIILNLLNMIVAECPRLWKLSNPDKKPTMSPVDATALNHNMNISTQQCQTPNVVSATFLLVCFVSVKEKTFLFHFCRYLISSIKRRVSNNRRPLIRAAPLGIHIEISASLQ